MILVLRKIYGRFDSIPTHKHCLCARECGHMFITKTDLKINLQVKINQILIKDLYKLYQGSLILDKPKQNMCLLFSQAVFPSKRKSLALFSLVKNIVKNITSASNMFSVFISARNILLVVVSTSNNIFS